MAGIWIKLKINLIRGTVTAWQQLEKSYLDQLMFCWFQPTSTSSSPKSRIRSPSLFSRWLWQRDPQPATSTRPFCRSRGTPMLTEASRNTNMIFLNCLKCLSTFIFTILLYCQLGQYFINNMIGIIWYNELIIFVYIDPYF